MKLDSLVLFLHAAHWSYLVGSKWDNRGGVMLIAPPGSLKSQVVNTLEIHERAIILADANVPSIARLREDVSVGRYRTIAFTEFEKLYQRNPETAKNVEGHLRAFVDEGFKHPSWVDSRMVGRKAYCLVIGAMTPNCYTRHYSEWQDSGFGRRFLWLHYCLADPGVITEAIHRWERIKFPGLTFLQLEEQELPYTLTMPESRELQRMLEVDSNTPFTLLKKIAVILKTAYPTNFLDIVRDVAPCLKGTGGELVIERRFEHERKSHYNKTAGPKVRRGSLRRNSRSTPKAANREVWMPGLETERELPDLPANGIPTDSRPKRSEEDKSNVTKGQ